MKIKTATVRAGRTVPHPLRSFANIQTSVELAGELDQDQPAGPQIDRLRIQAEQIVHNHQEQVVHSLRTGERLVGTAQRIGELEAELEALRKAQAEGQGLLFGTTEVREYGFDDEGED